MKAKQSLILRTDFDAAVCLGDIQNQGCEVLSSRAQWHTAAKMRKSGATATIRQDRVLCDSGDRAIHDETWRPASRLDEAEFPHSAAQTPGRIYLLEAHCSASKFWRRMLESALFFGGPFGLQPPSISCMDL